MSDVAQTTDVVVSTPTPVVEAPAPVLTNQSPKDAAKASLFASIAAAKAPAVEAPATPATPAVVVDANGRVHAPDGKFLPGAPEQAAPTDPAAAVTPQPTPANTDQQNAPPKQVRIPVPEGHWLRSRGRTEIPVDPELERDFRGLLKDTTRTEVSTLREELVRTQAQLRAAQEARQGIIANPDVLARINELRALGHDDLADAALRGLDSQSSEKASEYEKEQRAKYQQEDALREAQTTVSDFRDKTVDTARKMYPVWANSPTFDAAFQEAYDAYTGHVIAQENAGREVQLQPDFILRYMKTAYLHDEGNLRIAKERLEAKRRQQAATTPNDAQARHATLPPLAAIPSTARTGQLSTQPAAFNKTGMSPDDIRKHLKRELISR